MSRNKDATSLDGTARIDAGAVDPRALAARIARTLADHGWAHVAGAVADAEFEATARHLGSIELRTDLQVDPARAWRQREVLGADAVGRPVLFEPGGMDFHTDRPSARVIAWRCVEQDASGGESCWLDLRQIGRAFGPEELEALGRIEVGYAIHTPAGDVDVRYAPLVEASPDGPLVYWVPWRVRPPGDEEASRLLRRFVGYLRTLQDDEMMTLRLERGECLFLDNRRSVHGRATLPPDSRRHLVRLYINTDAGPSA